MPEPAALFTVASPARLPIMLIKVAGPRRLAETFGPMDALFVSTWPGGAEIRYKEKVVLFFDVTGEWMVGFPFQTIILAAMKSTPKEFHNEVDRWLRKTMRGETPPQREGVVW